MKKLFRRANMALNRQIWAISYTDAHITTKCAFHALVAIRRILWEVEHLVTTGHFPPRRHYLRATD